ncbi:amine oxidase [Geothermobacter hydrogeniphilus]|uniref:Amine oxidase n=1 Tax=Geothermobacter hydrogeniphilus TaxID=1969733 RepID=A0A2K2H6M9_9BACT|nr:FAD-dependent oxidoreductase [Geothermobacter hydrogeniphilus]PNU18900.1 amine oxidase [Geothermobacter hydrogeniphilus]
MKVDILGAGPCGLGALKRLHERGGASQLFESRPYVGGLSTSLVDDVGFTWDVGGHVLFSHYDYFDQVVEDALGGKYYSHQRECWVRLLECWVPYPFQNNVRHLPANARNECIEGLRNLRGDPGSARNFQEWMNAVFGAGIVRYFMEPYNFKVWATPSGMMSKDWIAERVSVVDLQRVEDNIREQKDDVAWGPNNLFKFPETGGTGAIFRGIAKHFSDKIHLNHELVSINLKKREMVFSNGVTREYEQLISTMPVDQLLAKASDVPTDVRLAAELLLHNSVYVVGIGVRGRREDNRCWMYFPENNCPFYRVTNFHNYSPHNVPGGDVNRCFSLMCEISYSPFKVVDEASIVEETIQGLVNSGLLDERERGQIISRFLLDVPYAYPIPSTQRDEALAVILPFLEGHGVYSRGRFGAWKYEVGNMDHSFMQGVEVVDRLVSGTAEKTVLGDNG